MATKKCSCGKCSTCKSYNKGKYTESKDKKKDAAMLRKAHLDKEERKEFEKKDKAHGAKKKPKTMAEDRKIDAKIIRGIKAKERAHEKREGKAGEKRENKREAAKRKR
jgi:hypothetical protein